MPRTIRPLALFSALVTLLSSQFVFGQPPKKGITPKATATASTKPVALSDPTKIPAILKDWESISSKLKTLEVKIKREDKSAQWGNETYTGMAMLQSPNLAYLNFQKEVTSSKGPVKLEDHELVICTGKEVWQYTVPTKQIFIFPLDKKDQKHALEEGPLPFLFNLKAAEAEARYTMELIRDEPTYYVIGVLPKLKIDKEGFSQAFIKLNKANYFPDRIMLISPDHKSTKDFTLTGLKANGKIAPANFQGTILGKPWQVVRDPGNEKAPKAAMERIRGAIAPPR